MRADDGLSEILEFPTPDAVNTPREEKLFGKCRLRRGTSKGVLLKTHNCRLYAQIACHRSTMGAYRGRNVTKSRRQLRPAVATGPRCVRPARSVKRAEISRSEEGRVG